MAAVAEAADSAPYGLFRCDAMDVYSRLDGSPPSNSRVVLYVHGWQPGAAAAHQGSSRPFALPKEGFLTPTGTYNKQVDTAEPWRTAGYDVLVFGWAPYADESTPWEVEQKIWEQEMRHPWREPKGKLTKERSPVGSMGQLLFEAVAPSLAQYEYVHLVGHSLGTQLIAYLLAELIAAGKPPQRVALLDPYSSNGQKAYLTTDPLRAGDWIGARIRAAVLSAADAHVPVEQNQSSLVTSNPLSDSNDELKRITAFTALVPEFLRVKGGFEDITVLAQRHSHAKYTYFRSKGCKPYAANASTSDADALTMMQSDSKWVQVGGTMSEDPADYEYQLQPNK